jgi:hypothetical protein
VSAVASSLSFEVLRFAAAPVSPEVALLELEGRFRAGARRRLGVPRLVAEGREGSSEIAPAAAEEAKAEPDGALWRATYAVTLDVLEHSGFSLAVGRQLLLELPGPDAGGATGDREVRLAREANALRRTADEARAAAGAALASVGQERAAREAAEATVAELRMARDDLARRAASLEEELAQARREHAAELVRRDEQSASAVAVRDQEATRLADERVAEVEIEAAEARRALKAARAEAEAARRELERERERAQVASAALPRGRVTELDGQAVEGEEAPPTLVVDDAPTEVAPTEVAPAEPVAGDPGETVRVLGARRRRPSGEGPPAEPAPGTAAIGARFIEPGETARRRAIAAWLARALAFAALVVVVIAVLLVFKAA